jgi:hypothetical protein
MARKLIKNIIPPSTSTNPFVVSNSVGESAISVNSEGYVVIDKLVLVDKKDGSKWDISIYDGELIYEPHGLENKRDFRINKVIS